MLNLLLNPQEIYLSNFLRSNTSNAGMTVWKGSADLQVVLELWAKQYDCTVMKRLNAGVSVDKITMFKKK